MKQKPISITDLIARTFDYYIQIRIGIAIMGAIKESLKPRTVYRLKKIIKRLEHQILTKYLELQEDIVAP